MHPYLVLALKCPIISSGRSSGHGFSLIAIPYLCRSPLLRLDVA